MRVGIDVRHVAGGNRSGLYTHLHCLVRELRPLLSDDLWLISNASGRNYSSTDRRRIAAEVAAAMDGARVSLVRQPPVFYRVWHRLSICNRVDVLLHNQGGDLPDATRGANAYVVPDVSPLAIDYGAGIAQKYRPYYERAVRYADVILVYSEHTKRELVERLGAPADRIRVAPLAAGSEFRPVQDRSRLDRVLAAHQLTDTPYVLMVATLELRKNHAALLRAFARLVKRDPSLRHKLVLVGGTWIGHETILDLIRESGLGDRVVYLGYAEDVEFLYAGADAFAYPSLYEGFGLPPLEAMASGVPVLAADTSSLPEVVGDAGILFQPHDDAALCEALHRVLTDSSHRADLIARGLARAEMFSWRRTAELYRDAFEFGLRRFQDRGSVSGVGSS